MVMWSEYDLKCEIVKNEQFPSPIILINYKDLQRIFMAAFEHFSHNIPELINSYTDTKADTLSPIISGRAVGHVRV